MGSLLFPIVRNHAHGVQDHLERGNDSNRSPASAARQKRRIWTWKIQTLNIAYSTATSHHIAAGPACALRAIKDYFFAAHLLHQSRGPMSCLHRWLKHPGSVPASTSLGKRSVHTMTWSKRSYSAYPRISTNSSLGKWQPYYQHKTEASKL